MRRSVLLLVITSLIVFSCTKKKNKYEVFFDNTFDIIKNKSIKKNKLEWNKIEERVKDSIKHFQNNEAAYNAIIYTLRLIDDGHSTFFVPSPTSPLNNKHRSIPDVPSKIVGNNIGYIKLTGFFANDSLSKLYAVKIRKALKKIDNSSDLSGWIIDLRVNTGGKMSPMPLGLSPLLQDSIIGYSVDNEGKYATQSCANNFIYWNGHKADSIDFDNTLRNKNKKIAVLVSHKTASEGEFLASALRFQKKTKLFGAKTKGKASHLELIPFSSKAKLLLCTQYMCNSKKEEMLKGLIPDIECSPDKSLELAIGWIE